jgi:hypothetical protein
LSDVEHSPRSDWLGGLVGILTFLVGIGLLLLTFRFAYDMFMVRPEDALGIDRKNPVDLGRTGESFIGILGRILFLLVMSAVASVIANRGIRLYAESRAPHAPAPRRRARDPEPRAEAAREH